MDRSFSLDRAGDVAIIGLAGRFPGAATAAEFWRNLRDGVESIATFSAQELEDAGVQTAALSQPNYVNARGIVENIALFDASFFGVNPREAELMDPQHRLFLECAWEALESAGYDPDTYPGRIGIYAGESMNTYFLSNLQANRTLLESVGRYQTFLGNDRDFLSTLISYKLNLKGPSVTVQTACSTSLVAVHLACQSLLNGESDLAMAGGVSISVPQKAGYLYVEGGIKSPDGHCRPFDRRAQGTVSGEGVGLVVLKRLTDAVAEGDHIEAVIRGSAMNNDGATKMGYTAPSVDGQAAVIAEAIAMAGVEPDTIGYVEAHGTATPLGDPIEIAALTQAFRYRTAKKGFCAVGSVKSNIGHLDAAAGIASLIKAVMALKHKLLPPSLHFDVANPQIDFQHSPFYVNAGLSEWISNGVPRRAGVSSFGIGGTNSHVVLEEAPVVEQTSSSRRSHLLVLSAKTNTALESMTDNLVGFVDERPELELADVAYTLQAGRKSFGHRRMVVCRDLEDGATALGSRDPQRVFTATHELGDPSIGFMFPGQGAQYAGMALGLYEAEPLFRAELDRCSSVLESHSGFDLRRLLYPTPDRRDKAAWQLRQTLVTQPALFVIEYALAKLLIAWGVRPRAMIGHSVGEYVAASLAGVFSLEDSLALISARGQLMQDLPGGAMLAVTLSEQDLSPLLGDQLSIAAQNAPGICVVSGPHDAVRDLNNSLSERGVTCHYLQTSHAFHSEMVDPILASFIEQIRRVNLNPPRIPFVSNVSGTWITDAEATDPSYWARHLRQTVRFAGGVQTLLQQPDLILLEVGPGNSLSTLVQQQLRPDAGRLVLNTLRHAREQHSDAAALLQSLGRLWLAGVRVDWGAVHRGERRCRVALPTYPFERQRYWIEGPSRHDARDADLLVKKPDLADWFYIPCWQRTAAPRLLAAKARYRKSSWLVFLDALGFGGQLAKRLEEEGHDVIRVDLGPSFAQIGADDFRINAAQPRDYVTLLDALRVRGKFPNRVLHLWSLLARTASPLSRDRFQQCQEPGFYSLLFLTQALAHANAHRPVRMDVVSNNLHNVTGEETLFPEHATVLALCHIIPQEHPHITCRNIDIAIASAEATTDMDLIGRLSHELAIDASDTAVAHRGGHRWTQSYQAIRLDTPQNGRPRLRSGGVYLITGGLGNIGSAVAARLAQDAKAKLVLLGRSVLPDRAKWPEWLANHDEQNPVSKKIRTVVALEEQGAEAMVITADVANQLQMRDAIHWTLERFGDLHGVVHAAGVADRRALHSVEETGPAECEQHFQAKAYGVLVLEQVLSERPLDFCILLSSLSSIVGGPGFLPYAAANAFMDSFVERHNRTSPVTWTSVNLDGWDVGRESARIMPMTSGIQHAMSSADGVEVLQRIICAGPLQRVVVSASDLYTRIDTSLKRDDMRVAAQSTMRGSTVAARHVRPQLAKAITLPRNETEQLVAEVWQELLALEQVGIDDNFFELGGHSLLGIQLMSRLRELFAVELSQHSLFETPTVAGLAVRIAEAHRGEGEDLAQIMPMLELVERLSDDDVSIRLSALRASREDPLDDA
jgi:acyl transferase domain-containing protein